MKIQGIELKWLGHSSFLIKTENGKVIYIDPYNLGKEKLEKADIILITHPHYDHCSLQDLEKIVRNGTTIVVPADCQSKISKLENIDMKITEAGQTLKLEEIKIGIVPAYNQNKEFHSKNEGWIGYVLKIGKTIIYHAGDTDLIPEMEKLSTYEKGEFIALLPVGGTYTMDAEEAAQAAFAIKPDLAIPMHFGSVVGSKEDAKKFCELCRARGIKSKILEKE